MKDQFSYEENEFFFAGGISAYDGKSHEILDDSLG